MIDNRNVFVPDHELIRLIGRGNYAEVWLARSALGTYRAIKITYEKAFQHKRPFEREFNGVLKFEPTSRLHEGLVDVLHVGRNDAAGYFYCVMELADDVASGTTIDPTNYSPRTLSKIIVERRQLPIRECQRLGITIASALDFLHRRSLVHRDVKPSNIIFVNGIPKLADVGLVAEMSDAKSYVGTEGYIPPEGPGTARADIYSLGKVLYEASTGKDRHDYPELPSEVDDSALNDLRRLNRVILKACHSNPDQRYKSAREMFLDLQALQQSTGTASYARGKAALAAAVLLAATTALWLARPRDSGRTELHPTPSGTPATQTDTFKVPSITDIEPASAATGTAIVIRGENFSSDVSSNIVYFGAVRATVLSATPQQLRVSVPAGATYSPITVTTGGKAAASSQIFQPTFSGRNVPIDAATFPTRVDLDAGNGPIFTAIADIDNDGRPDLIVNNAYSHTFSLFRNKCSSGSITQDSFDPRVDFPVEGGPDNPYGLAVADVDGDGKLDVIICDRVHDQISIFRNQSSPGPFTADSLAPRVNYDVGTDPRHAAVGDLNHDGKPDIVTANVGANTISILQNNGSPGHLLFARKADLPTSQGSYDVVVGDLDGDNHSDIAVRSTNGLSLFPNAGSGEISPESFAHRVDLEDAPGGLTIVLGDVDGDGLCDIITGSYISKAIAIHRRKSRGGLTAESYQRLCFSHNFDGHTLSLSDLNGDGKTDICLVGEDPSALLVYQNNSEPGAFTAESIAPPMKYTAGWNAWGVSTGDLDGDGRPEIVFANAYVDTISIYRNALP